MEARGRFSGRPSNGQVCQPSNPHAGSASERATEAPAHHPSTGSPLPSVAVLTTIAQFAAVAFSLLFVGAGLAKLDAPRSWAELVRRLPVRKGSATAMRRTLPAVEIGIGASLLVSPGVGSALATLALLAFSAAILVWRRELIGANCACFGAVATTRIGRRLLARNLLLAVLVGALFAWTVFAESTAPTTPHFLVGLLIGTTALAVHEARQLKPAGP